LTSGPVSSSELTFDVSAALVTPLIEAVKGFPKAGNWKSSAAIPKVSEEIDWPAESRDESSMVMTIGPAVRPLNDMASIDVDEHWFEGPGRDLPVHL
jgi:hypothetical protein